MAVSPVLADSTVYASALSCDLGTCTNTANAIDTDDATFGVFDKASGSANAVQATFTFGSTLTPATGTQITVLYKIVKGSQDPWCTLRWNSSNGGTYNAGVTITNSGTYTSSFLITSSVNLYSVLFTCSGNASAQTDNIYYIKASYLAPTPTASPTATTTATATFTSSPTATATATATGTPAVITYGGAQNYIKDGSFETYPFLNPIGFSPWASSWITGDIIRQTVSPRESWVTNQQVAPICGSSFWEQDPAPGNVPQAGVVPEPGVFDHTGTYSEQGFDWPGGNMYVSFGAQTGDATTGVIAQMLKPDSTVAIFNNNVSADQGWQMFHYSVTSAPAGRYTLQFKGYTTSPTVQGHVALDAVSVHEGYWVNDCGLPQALWNKDQSQIVVTATSAVTGPTATINYVQVTADSGTLLAQANGTSNAQATSTQIAGGTATVKAGMTATRNSVALTQGWQTATAIGNGVATLLASGQGTAARGTQTQQAYVYTATAVFNATSTAYAGNFRATLTAQAQKTQTSVAYYQTQNAASVATIYANRTQIAQSLTSTAAVRLTQSAVAPINIPLTVAAAQATAQARMLATNAAILTQSAQQQLTAQAQITTTANATVFAQATQLAQLQLTLQALATLQATSAIGATATAQAQPGQGQIEMPPQQPPASSDISCVYPTNALNLAWWIDYGVCQISWFFTLNTENLIQIQDMNQEMQTSAIIQTFVISNTQLAQIGNLLTGIDWEGSSLCNGHVFDPRSLVTVTSSLLSGNLGLPFAAPEAYDSSTCHTTLYATLVGPYIENGMCFTIHLLCITGIISLLQWIFDTVMILGFVFYLYNKLQNLSGF